MEIEAMSKLVVNRQAVTRTQARTSVPVAKPGISAAGIVGWVVAVGAGVILVFLVVHGQSNLQRTTSSWEAKLAEQRQRFAPVTQKLAQQRADLRAQMETLRNATREAQPAIRQAQKQLRQQERRNLELETQKSTYDQEFLRLKLEFRHPYTTLEELLADHARLLAQHRQRLATPAAPTAEPAGTTAAVRSTPVPAIISPALARNPALMAAAERDVPERNAADEPPAIARPEKKLIDIDTNSSRQSSKNRGTLEVKIKNGDFNNDFDGVLVHVVVLAAHKENRDSFRVMLAHQKRFDLKKRSTETVFDGNFRLDYEDYSYYSWYPYKYDSYVVVFCDQDGKFVTGKATRNLNEKSYENFLQMKEGDFCNSKGEKIHTGNRVW